MAYAFVKKASNAANSASLSFSPTSGGDLLIVCVATSSGGGTPTASITDNLTSGWQTAVSTVQSPSTGNWVTMFYLPNCGAGITTITLSFAGGTPGTCDWEVLEYSGIATSSPLIVASSANAQTSPGTATDAVTSGLINITSQPAMLFGWNQDASGNSCSAGTGFTSEGTALSWFTFEDTRVTATGNKAATFTTTHGTDQFVTMAAAFSEPVAASPGPGLPWQQQGAMGVMVSM